MTELPKHKRNRNWTYSEGCGCKVTFLGLSLCRVSLADYNSDCETHADTVAGLVARTDLHRAAKESLIEHSEELVVTHE